MSRTNLKMAASSHADAGGGGNRESKQEGPAPMYVPPGSVLKKIVRRSVGLSGEETVSMSARAFNKLLEAAFARVFDADSYLERFPDIKAAVDSGKLQSALHHYVAFGHGEGRLPRRYEVDEEWYLTTYPDVAKAVKSGHIGNATQHFENFGFAEGRAPNRSFEKVVAEWRSLEQRPPKVA